MADICQKSYDSPLRTFSKSVKNPCTPLNTMPCLSPFWYILQARADLAKAMLEGCQGAAFNIVPQSGVLQPFSEQHIQVHAYSDMWGKYQDTLVCKVSSPAQISSCRCFSSELLYNHPNWEILIR